MVLNEILGLAIGLPALISLIVLLYIISFRESKRLAVESKKRFELEERKVVALEKISDALQEVYDV